MICRMFIIVTDPPVTMGEVPEDQSGANTTWLAPPNIIEDMRIVWVAVKPLAIPSTPKTKPNGMTPSCTGSCAKTPFQNSRQFSSI